ncbi:MAG: hypothetical protein KF836_13105 [Fimbriimonadaceae bacterium]|nr:hypothetical protein [Fimbriimonadaceae bacterium]
MKKHLLMILILVVGAFCVGCGSKDDPAPNAAENMVTPTGNGEPSAAAPTTPTAPGKEDTPTALTEPNSPGNESPGEGAR